METNTDVAGVKIRFRPLIATGIRILISAAAKAAVTFRRLKIADLCRAEAGIGTKDTQNIRGESTRAEIGITIVHTDIHIIIAMRMRSR